MEAFAAAVSSAEFVYIVNTYAARHIVYNARTPEERAAANWNLVPANTANGITADFAPRMVSGTGGLSSNLYQISQRNVSNRVTCYRASYWLIGSADVSGAYQEWLGKNSSTERSSTSSRPTGPLPGGTFAGLSAVTAKLPVPGAELDMLGLDV